MFFCRRNPLLKVLLLLLGIKLLKRERWTEEEKANYRAKRREFRQKMQEAFDVWDCNEKSSTSSTSEPSADI